MTRPPQNRRARALPSSVYGELLVEILSEEIPARMQTGAAWEFKDWFEKFLAQKAIASRDIETFVTPRRLVLRIEKLRRQPAVTGEIKRLRADAPEEQVQGFLRSVRKTIDEVEREETEKGTYLVVKIQDEVKQTIELLPQILTDAMMVMHWPKSMRWGKQKDRWVRPIHSILCLFDGKTIPVTYTGVRSGNTTRGHRFLAPEPFTVKDFADYKAKLKKAHVVLDPAERRKVIWKEAQKLAKAEGLAVKEDDGLLAEVAGLVEWPKVFMGRIDEAFMDLPAEVLTTVMRHHQKYFSLVKKDGSLAPRFIVVADTEPDDGGKAITAGNERVLRARLADAKFFWDQDRKRTLISRIDDLDGVVFHAKLGSLGDKVRRIEALAANIAELLSFDADATREAARLCKADLTTDMVGEFPELQGVMGRYYALAEGRGETVAAAIAEHYSPQGPNDDCPSAPASVAVALADKIDSLVGFWSIDEKPTGSKDPFALRRAALGVIRLIVENKLRVSLSELFHKAYELYPLEIRASESVTSPHIDIGAISINLLLFFIDRLKVHLREKGVRHDLISAVVGTHRLDVGLEDNLVRLLDKVDAVKEFLGGEDGINLLTAYKRTANILRIEGEKDGVAYKGADVDDELLREGDEQALAARLGEVSALADAALGHEDFAAAMSALARLRKPVDGFFDQVTVNCDDADLRRNRLRLLGAIRNTMDRVADFSQIEG
jgi:glycyl-tRNA synthetase beta chain